MQGQQNIKRWQS